MIPSRPKVSSQAAQQGRGAADCGEYWQVAAAVARFLKRWPHLRQPGRPISPNVLDLSNEFMGMREAFLNLAQ
jgi:hypothetical protein